MDSLNRRLWISPETWRVFDRLALAAVMSVAVLAAIRYPLAVLMPVCGLAAAAVVMLWPQAGIYLVVALTPFESVAGLEFQFTKAVKLGIAIVTASSLLWRQHPSRRKLLVHDPYLYLLALMLASALLSSVLASSPLRSLLGFFQLGVIVAYYAAVRRENLAVKTIARLLQTIIAVSFPAAIWAVLQTLWGYSGFWGSPEQRVAEVEGGFDTVWQSLERAAGTFGSSNAAGAFFCAVFLIAALHAYLVPGRRPGYALAAGVAAIGIVATNSRGAILGLLLSGLLFLWIAHSKSRRWAAFALAGTLAAGWFLVPADSLAGYFRTGDDFASTSLSRVAAWQQAFASVLSHPLFGIGFYEFRGEMEGAGGSVVALIHPHNGLLKALVEQGLLGGGVYVCFVVVFFRVAVRTLRRSYADPELAWIFACIACVGACFFAQELFDAGLTLGGSSIAILFVTLLSVQTGLESSPARTPKDLPTVLPVS
jgi:O-antigen ligase